MENGISKSAIRMHELISEAIDKHEITIEEYDNIISISLEDNVIDAHESAMLTQLQDLIEDKTIKIINNF